MALPVGIDVAVVTFGQAVSYSGRTTSARLVVKPSVRLVYGGVPILDFPESSVAGAGQPGQMFLPVCDQSGFKATQNGVVVDFTGWSYTGTLTWTEDLTKETRQVTKIFQVLTGQSTIDFDELPDTVDALPVTAPVSGVTSFLGKTGAVTEEDLAELDLGGGLGDAGIADLVTTPGTELATALANSYAPLWQPNTAYAVGALAISPTTGQVGTAKAAFTSGATYNPANWNITSGSAVGGDGSYDLIIVLGQSNAKGQNTDFDAVNIDVADPRIFTFPGVGAQKSTIIPAVEPLLGPINSATGLGPGGPFAKLWVAANPNRKALLVPCAVGGTGFRSSGSVDARWLVGENVAGRVNLYENAITQITDAIAAAGPGCRIAAILWHHGETDSSDGITPATYTADLLALIDGLRTRIPALAATPFVMGQMAPERRASVPNAELVNLAQIEVPRQRDRTSFILAPTGYATVDATHFNAAGQRIMGRRFFEGVTRALANVRGTSPIAPAAVTTATVGTDTVATWDRPLCRITDYTVQYQVESGGTWTTLTRAQSINNTATIPGAVNSVRVRTVNEAGTSDYTASPSLALAAGLVPTAGKIAGVTPSPTSLYVIAPKSSSHTAYTFQYRKVGASSWSSTAALADPAATLTGLDANSVYEVRYVPTLTSGSAEPSAVTKLATSNAQSALTFGRVHGLRKLISAYAGPAIRVKRAADAVEQDIAFSGVDIDLAALLTFAGTDTLTVVTMYDQSGNARHFTQATVAAQPVIVSAGALVTLNGRPAPIFDGTDDFLDSTAVGTFGAGASTFCGVVQTPATSTSTSRTLFNEGRSSSSTPIYALNHRLLSLTQQVRNTAATDVIALGPANAVNETPALARGEAVQLSVVDNGTVFDKYIDGTALASIAYTRTGTFTIDRASLGAQARSTVNQFWQGHIAELAIAHTALSASDRQALQAQQKAYYGTV